MRLLSSAFLRSQGTQCICKLFESQISKQKCVSKGLRENLPKKEDFKTYMKASSSKMKLDGMHIRYLNLGGRVDFQKLDVVMLK